MPEPTGKDRDSSQRIDKAPGIQIHTHPAAPHRQSRRIGLSAPVPPNRVPGPRAPGWLVAGCEARASRSEAGRPCVFVPAPRSAGRRKQRIGTGVAGSRSCFFWSGDAGPDAAVSEPGVPHLHRSAAHEGLLRKVLPSLRSRARVPTPSEMNRRPVVVPDGRITHGRRIPPATGRRAPCGRCVLRPACAGRRPCLRGPPGRGGPVPPSRAGAAPPPRFGTASGNALGRRGMR